MSSSTILETDVAVIGSGIGGLSCAALLGRYGFDIPGGAAHGFDRGGYRFDSGSSPYSGMSYRELEGIVGAFPT